MKSMPPAAKLHAHAGAVALTAAALEARRAELQQAVDAARAEGVPWAVLAAAVGVKPTTMRARHGGGAEAVAERRERHRLRAAARAAERAAAG